MLLLSSRPHRLPIRATALQLNPRTSYDSALAAYASLYAFGAGLALASREVKFVVFQDAVACGRSGYGTRMLIVPSLEV